MDLDIIGEIEEIRTIAVGGRIHDIMRIRKQYGPGRWRKLKGVANVRLHGGRICKAEVQRSIGTKPTEWVERRSKLRGYWINHGKRTERTDICALYREQGL